jgi:hypothetical protein
MSAALGLVVVMFGALSAYRASRSPAGAKAIETAAGILMIAGFALIGSALPMVV